MLRSRRVHAVKSFEYGYIYNFTLSEFYKLDSHVTLPLDSS